MSSEDTGVASKLENAFLGILRVVILIVLAISLVAAVVLGANGVSDMSAAPTQYKQEKFDSKALIQELKDSLKEKPVPAPRDANSPTVETPAPKTEASPLEDELSKQVKIVGDFLNRYQKSLSNPEGFKNGQRNKAKTLAVIPKSDASVLEYAKGQTELFQVVFTDKDILDILAKRHEEVLGTFFDAALDLYPDFFKKQRQLKDKFESQEQVRVLEARAGAMMKFYISGGLFAAFLLISLILVLVKIERNLRVKPACLTPAVPA